MAQRMLEQEGASGTTSQPNAVLFYTCDAEGSERERTYDFKTIFLCPTMTSSTTSRLPPQALQTITCPELRSVSPPTLLPPCGTGLRAGVLGTQVLACPRYPDAGHITI